MHEMVAPLNDAATAFQIAAERAFLIVLEGSCRTPLAGHAVLDGDRLHFRGMALLLDGSEVFEARREGSVDDAEALGRDAGEEVKRLAGSTPGGLASCGSSSRDRETMPQAAGAQAGGGGPRRHSGAAAEHPAGCRTDHP
jgi:hypothetical protein